MALFSGYFVPKGFFHRARISSRPRGIFPAALLLGLVTGFVTGFNSSSASAQGQADLSLRSRKSLLVPAPNVFARQYAEVGYARNFPFAYSTSRYLPGIAHPLLTYRYFLTDTWMLGLAGQFKFFGERLYNEDLVFLTLSQEGFYVQRLYHPFYGLLGAKLHYLYPARKGMVPLQRHPRSETEIGVAAAAGLLWRLSPAYLIELKIDRWRGTKTMRYHGLELNLSFGVAL